MNLKAKALHGRNVTSQLNGLLSGPVALFDNSRTTLVVSPMDNFKHSVQLGILLGFLTFMLSRPARLVRVTPHALCLSWAEGTSMMHRGAVGIWACPARSRPCPLDSRIARSWLQMLASQGNVGNANPRRGGARSGPKLGWLRPLQLFRVYLTLTYSIFPWGPGSQVVSA